MPRYKRTKVFSNDEEYYDYLRKNRGIKRAVHYATPQLRNPTVSERASLLTTSHIWSYGDRFYNLAFKYYGDVNYWWIIAWYNAVPTEADIRNGDLIDIPVNLNDALAVLGV
tara:strand:+ start:617 stop:952 length:336 start_codon:yes stop_codon:yes gene_type:complete